MDQATSVVRANDTAHKRATSALWTNIAVAAVSLTVAAIALTYTVVVRNLTDQIDYLTASDRANRIETVCRAQSQADLDGVRAELSLLNVDYNSAFKAWLEALLSRDPAEVTRTGDLLDQAEDDVREKSTEVEAALQRRRDSPVTCAVDPKPLLPPSTAEPQPSDSSEVG